MNPNYVAEFRNFRDEFRRFKESPFINHNPVVMDQEWLNSPAFFGRSGTSTREDASYTASTSLSSSSQRATPISTPSSSDSKFAIAREEPNADEEATDGNDSEGLKEGVHQVTENGESPAPGAKIAPQRSRKGHKKSRQGCYNCKRRKIKCQETQPECENCTRKNLKCNYPAPKTLSELQLSTAYSPSPVTSVTLQSTPTAQFSLLDMRLFHHFLMTAYPHLPVGNDSAWLCQVPLIAHHNEYLMHAILGLAASHLELTTGADLHSVAIHHRVLAIEGSNAAISKPRRSGSDADALLGACYALVFQSAFMRDGLPEFFQMVRGCSLLSEQLKSENVPMAFFLTEKDHFQYMEDKLLDLPVISKELIDGAGNSLAALPPLFSQPSHPHFYQLLTAVIEALNLGSLAAYFKFIMVYQGILKMESQMFQEFIDSENSVARLLIAHFLAIQMIVAPIVDREYNGRARAMPVRGHMDWISSLYINCPVHLRKYMEWPVAVKECVRDELGGKEKLIPTISILRKKEGLSKSIC